jgi:DNA polymerase III delta' subunit
MTKNIVWKNLMGQERAKEALGSAFRRGSLGHAYLFCGDAGVGKFQAAVELSMAILCEKGPDVPCYSCDSCVKIERNAHQDFHVIAPVTLEKEHKSSDGKLNQDGWRYLSQSMREKINRPYAEGRFQGTASVPVEWVKEINHAIMRGAVSAGKNITIIDDIDALNKESANAMLKTLEEPPANTLLVLITFRPQSVLPTIISRCQLLRFGAVSEAIIKDALVNRFEIALSPAATEAVRLCMGSPGRALWLCENSGNEELHGSDRLLALCVANDWHGIGAFVDERAVRGSSEENEKLLIRLAYGVRSRFLSGIAGSTTYIDGLDSAYAGEFPPADCASVERLIKACQDAITALRSYGNVSLVFVNFILTVMEIIHGK